MSRFPDTVREHPMPLLVHMNDDEVDKWECEVRGKHEVLEARHKNHHPCGYFITNVPVVMKKCKWRHGGLRCGCGCNTE